MVMAIVWRFVLAVAGVALLGSWAAEALPARPVGYYTFDGEKLRPINLAQRRSDEPGEEADDEDEERPSGLAALVGNINWKLPSLENTRQRTAAFLSAIIDRGDSEEGAKLPGITSQQLLPDYLTHQEFIKPQLQAAGFSGGRIIAGPFPVPLSSLPKPPGRSIPSGPIPHIPAVAPPVAPPVAAQVAPSVAQHVAQQAAPSVAQPAKVKPAKPQSVKLLKPPPPPPTTATTTTTTTTTPAPVTVRPFNSYKPVQFPAVKVSPVRAAPTTQAPKKLVYAIPTGGPVHWYAAHSSGPEKPVSVLGVPAYSHPATLEASVGGTRLSYGGWTPMYSPSYASVNVQQEPSDERPQHVTERNVVPQTAAPQTLDVEQPDDQAAEQSVVRETVALPRIVFGAGSVGSPALTSEAESDAAAGASSASVTASSRRTVRKRKAKQVRPVRRVVRPLSGAEPAPDQEVAASEPAAPREPAPLAGAPSEPVVVVPAADHWSLGQVQGRSLTGYWVPAVEVSDLTEALSSW